MYLPALVSKALFSPIPASSSEPNKAPLELPLSLDQSVLSLAGQKKWTALAVKCEQEIVSCDPSSTEKVLKLWCLRFKALLCLRDLAAATREMDLVYAIVLQGFRDTQDSTVDRFPAWLPFELEVLHAGLPAFHGDGERAANRLSRLLRASQRRLATNHLLWQSRVDRLTSLVTATLRQIHGLEAAGVVASHARLSARDEQRVNAQIQYECILSALAISQGGALPAFDKSTYPETLTLEFNALSAYRSGDYAGAAQFYTDAGHKYKEGRTKHSVAQNRAMGSYVNNSAVSMIYELLIDESLALLRNSAASSIMSDAIAFNYSTLADLRLHDKRDIMMTLG